METKRCELELRQKESELKDREKEREYQLQLKQVENKGNDDADNESFTHERSIDYKVLPTQHKGEDVLEFFNLFEKTAKLHNIDEKRWHLSIGNKFNEATRQVFQRLSIEEMQSYAQIKEALLKHLKLSPLTHYIKFRYFEKDPKDTFNQFGNSLTEVFDWYLESKQIKDFDTLHDDMILQKFIENLRGNIRRYMMDKDPQTLLEATKLCDHYVANISGSPGRTRKQFSFGNNSHQESNHGSGNSGFEGATRFRGTNRGSFSTFRGRNYTSNFDSNQYQSYQPCQHYQQRYNTEINQGAPTSADATLLRTE